MRERTPASTAVHLVPAPLWRRSIASVIDVIGVVVGITVPSALVAVLAQQSDRLSDLLDRGLVGAKERVETRSTTADRMRVCQIGSMLATEVERRNRQTYGQKVMHIRRVDAGDGGSVKVKSAIVRHAVSQLLWASSRRATRQAAQRSADELTALKTELPELKRTIEDPELFRREAMKALRHRAVGSITLTFAAPVIQLAVQTICIVALPRRRSLSDLIAGIVTTADQPDRAQRRKAAA